MEIKEHYLKPETRQFNAVDIQDKIYLSIQIGNGQIGGTKVILDGQQVAKGNLSKPTFIGDTVKLLDKEIEIETNVLDVNHFTNSCVITTSILNQDNKLLYSKIDNGDAPESGVASFKGKYKLTILPLVLQFICMFWTNFIFAQATTFQSLETPSSPGFILLDKAPSSIERPTTPQGFGINVLGLLQGKGGAMEFAPFWLIKHPEITAEDMYKNKIPILYNFSISTATIKTDSSSYITGGFRTRIFQFYSDERLFKLDSIKGEIELALVVIDSSKIERLQKQYSEIIDKPNFTIDFAGAIGGVSTSNSFSNLALTRWATWLSLNWRPMGKDMYFTALTRYMNNERFEEYTIKADLLDVGARLNYDISKFCLSLEYLHRINMTNNIGSDFRIALVGSYEFSENIYFTTTFGKNFSEVNNIIALAGINFGISTSKVKAF